LYNTAKRNNTQFNVKLKKAHNNYYARLFDTSFDGNKRQFWQYIKAKRKDTNVISTITVDGIPFSDTLSKAEALNNQFIFTESFKTGNLPTDWLTANVCPIYKKGKCNFASNYRPISNINLLLST